MTAVAFIHLRVDGGAYMTMTAASSVARESNNVDIMGASIGEKVPESPDIFFCLGLVDSLLPP